MNRPRSIFALTALLTSSPFAAEFASLVDASSSSQSSSWRRRPTSFLRRRPQPPSSSFLRNRRRATSSSTLDLGRHRRREEELEEVLISFSTSLDGEMDFSSYFSALRNNASPLCVPRGGGGDGGNNGPCIGIDLGEWQ